MKPQTRQINQIARATFFSVAIAGMTAMSHAQNWSEGFDTGSIWETNTPAATWQWWGGCTTTTDWSTNDAGGDPNSGSIYVTVTWPSPSGQGDFQYSRGLSLSGVGNYNSDVTISPLSYTNFEFDILWDPNSTVDVTNHSYAGGDPNWFGFGFATASWGQTWVPNANQPQIIADGQWHHYSIPLNQAWPTIPGLIFKKWMPNDSSQAVNNAGNTSAFYIDNLQFNYNTNQMTPMPTLKLAKATKGLSLTTAQSGQQYQRQSVRSIPADPYQWYGNPNPLTYSLTIDEFPSGATYGGFQAHIFLCPDGAGGVGPDWDDPSVIFVQFQENADGTGVCNFRFKTNSPSSNGVGASGFFGTGHIMQLIAPTVTGTWDVTFTNDSHITVVGPGGVSTNFNMGADAASYFLTFAPSMATYFGVQNNNLDNIGQRAVFSRIKITEGATTIVDDSFQTVDPTQETDISLWINLFSGGVMAAKVVNEDAYWLDWNKPDGFLSFLEASSSVSSGWADAGLDIRDHGTRRAAFAGTNFLINFPSELYFRLTSTNLP